MKSDMIFFNCVRYGPPHNKPRIVPGLCNRLRGMFSVYAFADFLNIPFGFSWHPSNPCPCQFHELFEVPPDLVYENERKWLNKKSNQIEIKLFRTFDTPWHFWNTIIKNDYALTWENFYDIYKKQLRKLKPIPKINKKIISFTEKNNINERIGLHIRKTDNGVGNKNKKYRTNEDWYFNMIDTELDNNDQSKFFLATDNPESRLKIMERYGDKVISFTTQDDFNIKKLRQTTMEDSIVDFYCLSLCKRLYGENGSSFSDVASELGNIEFIRSEWNV